MATTALSEASAELRRDLITVCQLESYRRQHEDQICESHGISLQQVNHIPTELIARLAQIESSKPYNPLISSRPTDHQANCQDHYYMWLLQSWFLPAVKNELQHMITTKLAHCDNVERAISNAIEHGDPCFTSHDSLDAPHDVYRPILPFVTPSERFAAKFSVSVDPREVQKRLKRYQSLKEKDPSLTIKSAEEIENQILCETLSKAEIKKYERMLHLNADSNMRVHKPDSVSYKLFSEPEATSEAFGAENMLIAVATTRENPDNIFEPQTLAEYEDFALDDAMFKAEMTAAVPAPVKIPSRKEYEFRDQGVSRGQHDQEPKDNDDDDEEVKQQKRERKQQTLNRTYVRGQLVINGQLYPASIRHQGGSTALQLSVQGEKLNRVLKARLRLDVSQTEVGPRSLSSATGSQYVFLLWGLSGESEVVDVTFADFKRVRPGDLSCTDYYVDMTISTNHDARRTGMSFISKDWDDDTKATVAAMNKAASARKFVWRLHWSAVREPQDIPENMRTLAQAILEPNIPVAFDAYCYNGVPVIDYSQQVARKKLADLNALFHHSRQTYFFDLREAEVRLATPPKTVQMLEEHVASRVNKRSCSHVLFKQLSEDVVVAFVKANLDFFSVPDEEGITEGLPKVDGEKIIFNVMLTEDDGTNKLARCRGVRTDQTDHRIKATFCVRLESWPRAAVERVAMQPQNDVTGEVWCDIVDIKVPQSDTIARNQVDAIKDLTRTSHWQKFQPVLLNLDYEDRYVDVFEGTSLTEAQIQQLERLAIDGKFSTARAPLKPAQAQAIRALRRLPHGILLLNGAGGTGKTATIATAVSMMVSAGIQCVVTCETHTATNNIHASLRATLGDRFGVEDPRSPQRVYRQADELAYFKTLGKFEQFDNYQDLLRSARTAQELDHANQVRSVVIARLQSRKKFFRHPERGLSASLLENFTTKGSPPVYAKYPTGRELAPKERPPPGLDRAEKADFEKEAHTEWLEQFDNPGPKLNMVKELEMWIQKLKAIETASSDEEVDAARLTKLDYKKIEFCWNTLRKDFISRKRLIVTTLNNLFSDLIRTAIAKGLDPNKGVVIVVDEATTATEQAIWAAAVKLIGKERIMEGFGGVNPLKAIIMAGDTRQAWPLNKWTQYLEFPFEYPLFCRLIDGGFPVHVFTEQVRMHPRIGDLASKRFYNDTLTHAGQLSFTFEPCDAFPRGGPGLFEHISKFLCNAKSPDGKRLLLPRGRFGISPDVRDGIATRRIDYNMRVWLFSVDNSASIKDCSTSDINLAHVEAISNILLRFFIGDDYMKQLRENQGRLNMRLDWNDLVILTGYASQRTRIVDMLSSLGKRIGRDLVSTISVRVLDSYQSEEKKFVILDVTRDGSEDTKDFGFMKDERRAAVAMTRPREFFFVVADKNWIDHPIYNKKWKNTVWVEGIEVRKTKPALVELIERLVNEHCYTELELDTKAKRNCRPQRLMQLATLDSFDSQGNHKPESKKYHPEALRKYGWILEPRAKKDGTDDNAEAGEGAGAQDGEDGDEWAAKNNASGTQDSQANSASAEGDAADTGPAWVDPSAGGQGSQASNAW